jgi:hypothetical protein
VRSRDCTTSRRRPGAIRGRWPCRAQVIQPTLVGTKVFVAGGEDNASNALQSTTLYDIGAGYVLQRPQRCWAPRELHTATVIADGKVLLSGGTRRSGSTFSVALTPLAEIYDPANAATPFAAASFASGTGRYGHGATALNGASGLPDGRVLVTGGQRQLPMRRSARDFRTFRCGNVRERSAADFRASWPYRNPPEGWSGAHRRGLERPPPANTCTPLNTAEIWTGASP